jgi:hypothetical protein
MLDYFYLFQMFVLYDIQGKQFLSNTINPLLSRYLLLYMAEVASTGTTKLLEWK